jgi:hypothetical protein
MLRDRDALRYDSDEGSRSYPLTPLRHRTSVSLRKELFCQAICFNCVNCANAGYHLEWRVLAYQIRSRRPRIAVHRCAPLFRCGSTGI